MQGVDSSQIKFVTQPYDASLALGYLTLDYSKAEQNPYFTIENQKFIPNKDDTLIYSGDLVFRATQEREQEELPEIRRAVIDMLFCHGELYTLFRFILQLNMILPDPGKIVMDNLDMIDEETIAELEDQTKNSLDYLLVSEPNLDLGVVSV